MRNLRVKPHKESISTSIWKFINNSLFKLNLLLTFLGILPLIVFIYFNVFNFNALKVVVGCIALITMIKANKSIQGG